MPAPTAPGADWRKARQDYETGVASISDIAARCGVTPQAVTNRRAREGWHPPLKTRAADTVSAEWLARVDAVGLDCEGHRHRTRHAAAVLCDAVSRGLPETLAAPLAGMPRETLGRWKEDDEKLQQLLAEANARFAQARVQNVTDAADRGDAQSARWMLERHSATREHFRGAENTGGLQIHVAFGFMAQPNAAPTDGPVIEAQVVEDGAELHIEGPKADK